MNIYEFNSKCRALSKTQFETLNKMRELGRLIRWEGGFWSYDSARTTGFVPDWSGNQCPVPEWYCGISTLRALSKRGLVHLDEANRTCSIVEINN